MGQQINIYCDESCHLPHDGNDIMVLGAITCPLEELREVSQRIRDIKIKHGISTTSEIKWNKVSPKNADFYCDILDYYFDKDDLCFRGVVATGKKALDHVRFAQDHDTWYFKMYFLLLQSLLESNNHYKIFIDVKDTKSQEKIRKLHEVLCNKNYDFDRKIIRDVRTTVSHFTPCMQLADLIAGALSYVHRGLQRNEGKLRVIEKMRKRSGKSLEHPTLLREKKLNIFIWKPTKGDGHDDIQS